ncbi:MAG: metallophosphoesterase [Candidatus Aminicenantales bacterium]
MIGIMADSHDNVTNIRRAVELFNDARCSLVIHAGDFIAPFAARELGGLKCRVKAVYGNCDGEREGLRKAFEPLGEIEEAPHSFSFQNLNFFLVHLDFVLDKDAASKEYDVAVFAHTHKPQVTKRKNTLFINPGEAGGWLSGRPTVVLLDQKSLTAEIVAL